MQGPGTRHGIRLAYMLWAVAGTAGAAPGPDEARFVDHMVARHGFERAALERLLGEARYDQQIIDAITRPAEAMPWYRYQRIFLTGDRIAGGIEYWRRNANLLAEAEKRYGVPADIITAIVGIESKYGAYTGSYRVVDALKTLGFSYPKRGDFFRGELEHFLLMAREENMDPLEPLGSYAGAMGMPQFIASSFRAYATDFDGDGRRDLWNSDADVIGSIANYLARHGWQAGEPVAQQIDGMPPGLEPPVVSASRPDRPLSEFASYGVEVPEGNAGRMAMVIALDEDSGKSWWLGFDNFYVITRYNHSNLYAMAVHQLSEAIRERRAADTRGKLR